MLCMFVKFTRIVVGSQSVTATVDFENDFGCRHTIISTCHTVCNISFLHHLDDMCTKRKHKFHMPRVVQ
jgi:hypothetical protein